MTTMEKKELERLACKIRMDALQAVYSTQNGCPGGSLSSVDLLAYLYFREMNVDPQISQKGNYDRFVLSQNRCVPSLYAIMVNRGFFSVEDLPALCRLQGGPEKNEMPAADVSAGSPGQGLSVAVGMALAARYQERDCRIYVLLSAGETAAGRAWEAFQLAYHYKLENLCVMIEQSTARTVNRAADSLLPGKLRAFGLQVAEADGHDFESLEQAFAEFHESRDIPTAIIVRTVTGRNVSFMENQESWQNKVLSGQTYEAAVAELNARLAKLEAGCDG